MIFLFRFDLKDDGIDFVLNEGLAAEMYPKCEELLKPLVFSTCQVLTRYKHFSKSDTNMTGTLLDTNEFKVTLSEGLGEYIDPYTKHKIIFEHAKLIADVLFHHTEFCNRL